MTVSTNMSFIQKFGLKYYTFLFNIVTFICVFELTYSTEIVMLLIVLIPNLGSFLPNDDQQKTPNANEINKKIFHMLAPVTYVGCVYFMIYYVWINYELINHSYQSLFSAIFALTYTIAQSIDGSHQLIHRNQFIFRAIGFIGLVPFQFTTYPIQHLYMHHKKVGTEEDAITAPKNMSIYKYYVRAIYSSYRQTFKYSKVFFAFCVILNFSYIFFLYKVAEREYNNDFDLAIRKVGFFILFAYKSLFIMQCIQYIEHYGLIYRKNGDGKPVLQMCSWNTVVNPIYNYITFRFQRHSDHHMNAYKIYSTLQLNDKMPQYPFTFPQALLVCWFSPIWYKIVNPLVDKVLNNQKLTQEDLKKSNLLVQLVVGSLGILFILNAYFGYQNLPTTY